MRVAACKYGAARGSIGETWRGFAGRRFGDFSPAAPGGGAARLWPAGWLWVACLLPFLFFRVFRLGGEREKKRCWDFVWFFNYVFLSFFFLKMCFVFCFRSWGFFSITLLITDFYLKHEVYIV